MATYAIGDIQGCYQTLQKLLKQIKFDSEFDTLWIAGDLINRGANSLATLEFIYQYRNNIQCVLGNHDLHFLAIDAGQRNATKKDTFDEILNSPNRAKLTSWLMKQPLFHYDDKLNFAMSHAGIPNGWSIEQAKEYSSEVNNIIQSEQRDRFFHQMYGNLPAVWHHNLEGFDRLRFITNALTRMRYCYSGGELELSCKVTPGEQPNNLVPWYELSANKLDCSIVFGHWASLNGKCDQPNIHALDTGCVWGGKLTALRLEDKKLFACDSVETKN
jgi:bis(5'-nucleosyl)-tetraphosphatase (symmetrical)